MSKMTKDDWNKRYAKGGNSGYGSYGTQAQLKLDRIRKYIPKEEIESICDFGCGDFAFGKRICELFPKAHYVGLDWSEEIIKKNNETYPDKLFYTMDKPRLIADLMLCIDVLFHLEDNKECRRIFEFLKGLSEKYLVLTACEFSRPEPGMADSAAMFNYKQFGEPILRELVEPENTPYAYLYIYKF